MFFFAFKFASSFALSFFALAFTFVSWFTLAFTFAFGNVWVGRIEAAWCMQEGDVNNASTQQKILGRAGKESPSAAKFDNQESGKIASCRHTKSVRAATKVQVQVNDPSCEPPPFPRGNFGVISLFDGVSSVVPALCRKLGKNPAVIVLAEVDPALRELVSFEFGYCRQETWRVSFAGLPVHLR